MPLAATPAPAQQHAGQVTRFPATWLRLLTGDTIRALSLVGDYALAHGTCYAADATLAARLGLSRGGLNALLRSVEASAGSGPALLRSTSSPGRGTRTRWVRRPAEGELAVCVPAAARDALHGNAFKVYCALAVREHFREATSLAQICQACSITPRTARRCLAELVSSGWIIRAVQGAGTANNYHLHRRPLAGIATQLALFPEPRRRSHTRTVEQSAVPTGECEGQLSLASIRQTPVDAMTATPVVPTTRPPVGPVTQGGSLHQDLENKQVSRAGCSREAAPAVTRTRATARPVGTPGTAMSPLSADDRRILEVALAPAVHLLQRIDHPGARRRLLDVARHELVAIAGLTDLTSPHRILAARMQRRLRQQGSAPITSPLAWLLGRGLPARPTCGDRLCDDGLNLASGETCARCEDNHAFLRTHRRKAYQAITSGGHTNPSESRAQVELLLRREHHERAARPAPARRPRRRHAIPADSGQLPPADPSSGSAAVSCSTCGTIQAEPLCGQCHDLEQRDHAVDSCVDLILAVEPGPGNGRWWPARAAEITAELQAAVDATLRHPAASGATLWTLAVLGRLAAEELLAHHTRNAEQILGTFPQATRAADQARAASLQQAGWTPHADADTRAQAADEAAGEARTHTAARLLHERLAGLRARREGRQDPGEPGHARAA